MSKAIFTKVTHTMDDTDLSGSFIIYCDNLAFQTLEEPIIFIEEDMVEYKSETCIHMSRASARKLYKELKKVFE